jgi:glycosyltransferase involved in cell wall biosynthesis
VKILFVIGSLQRAGAERQMILTARGLNELGHTVEILCWDSLGALAEEARDQGITVRELKKRTNFFQFKPYSYIRAVKSFRPQVIYPYLPKQHLRATLLKWFTRPSKIVWGICASEVDWKLYRLRARIFFPMTVLVSRFADLYISNSESGAAYHTSIGYSVDKMIVIPNGIDTEIFRESQVLRVSQRETWGVDNATIVVGMLARFDPLKGQDVFIQAARILKTQLSNCLFVMTGSHTSEQAREFLNQAENLNFSENLLIEQATSHPEKFLNGVDVLVMPSLSEGLPNLLLEGLACRTRMVCTDVGDVALTLAGREFLVPPNEPDLLAEGVLESLRVPRDSEYSNPEKDSFGELASRTELAFATLYFQKKKSQKVLVIGLDKFLRKNRLQLEVLGDLGWTYTVLTSDTSENFDEFFSGLEINHKIVKRKENALSRVLQLMRVLSTDFHHVELYVAGRATIIFLSLLKIKRKNIVVIERGDIGLMENYSFLTRLGMRYAYRFADQVWYKEPYMLEILQTFRRKELHFLPNATLILEKEKVNKEIDFLWANRMLETRLPHLLVSAMSHQNLSTSRCVLVGFRSTDVITNDSDYEISLLSLLPPNVEAVSWTDPAEYMARARFFVMLGDKIFGNHALLESMAQGVVPIVSESIGISSLITHGVNGFITGTELKEIEIALMLASSLTQGEWKKLSDNAKLTIAAHYSPDTWAQNALRLYSRVG